MTRKLIEDNAEDSILRTALVTGGIGVAVGTLAALVSIVTGFITHWWAAAMAPILSGTISVLAGVGSTYLEQWLVNLGVKNNWLRKIAALVVVVTIGGLIFVIIILKTGIFKTIRPALWGVGIGYIFGGIVMVVDHRLWKMRKKVLTLELENKYLSEIAEKESLLQEKTRNLIVAQERNRLARELHDSVSQGIQGIIYAVHSLRNQSGGEELNRNEVLDHLEITARTTLDELRTMIDELKPSLLEEKGLIEAVKLQCDLFANRQQIKVNLELEEVTQLSPRQELALYRIVQESLGNVQKHAKANKVDLELNRKEESVNLTITDDGGGFNLEEVISGNGLKNMKQRCRENDGELEIESKPGAGTKVKAVFKLNNK